MLQPDLKETNQLFEACKVKTETRPTCPPGATPQKAMNSLLPNPATNPKPATTPVKNDEQSI